ncbi:hypothetical protein JI749_10255 [Devosia oryziradicis]|uniref:Uncharacterized protein n=1 Tax=Devosia oryziradicis TaxID=2801335 RepID=A0ABX7BT84_9HYPH|nr:hypothetical protein [Devosia oryziradicis]QQR34768.1 hypothetical protein JI749_10255 [Devosia oryziradicis]
MPNISDAKFLDNARSKSKLILNVFERGGARDKAEFRPTLAPMIASLKAELPKRPDIAGDIEEIISALEIEL